ncbi:hypothetical protein WD019_19030 [Fictibacillus sp. Mic-4]|uniref:hypothetical protein n=1 Tax=Fictibacillus TaxID=1329200 RepID=UPI0004171B86|nr:hypothetical protein [Fictibacillus gelatini]HAJ3957197.1 hypothetical protein [Escherichia coli]
MKVSFKDNVQRDFPYKKGDYVTVVVRWLYENEKGADLYYHGTITDIDNNGFWCVLDDNKTQEEYFSFSEIENVIDGDRIPGSSKRRDIDN